MPRADFVHLHLHTEYSLLDGAVRFGELMKKAQEFGMDAVAKTDHGNLYGAVEFYQEAKKAGINPIIGCEAYIAPGSLHDRKTGNARDTAYHFTLLAQNDKGYRNLLKLVSTAHLEGHYYKPRIDKALLAQHSEGLIGMSACLKSEINVAIESDQLAKARQFTAEYRDIFGAENFYLELHDHGMEAQRKCNRALPALAREFGVGLVAANDVHFLERSHHEAHDVMMCIGTGAMVSDEKRMRYKPELYFKSPAEMRALFGDLPESLSNTLAIAEKCELQLDFSVSNYPAYPPPPGKSREEFLRELCYTGFRERYGERAEDDVALLDRLNYELSVLEKTGFVSYFLIVWDFIHFARQQGIPVGPGRGSAAGSMVAYVLRITDIDPLAFGLIFERFLNPDRISPPDIDVDFCEARRGEVIEYVRRKYGERCVSQIITFGKLKAKSVVRDVSRVMGMTYAEGDRIARMIPNELGITLNSYIDHNGKHHPGAVDKNPDLKKAVADEPATKKLWEYATFLEGLSRNAGTHAAAVVIADCDLAEHVPLSRGKGDEVITQYAMKSVGDVGLLKMDFLGLKNLTAIQDAVTLVRLREPEFCIEHIPFDSAEAFALLNRGETIGIFQLESGGMVNLCRQFDIQKIDDIIALIALYRPGPMDLIPDYIKRKKGLTKIKYEHPLLEKVCADTYGIMIYQEQVMAAASSLAGYTLGQSDLLRRAMGKKDHALMSKERRTFIDGCARTNNIGEKKGHAIFDLLEKFAGYGFNKSHSAAYGLISYQTAYLKGNYPVEFMAALLSNEVDNTDKISILVGECQRMGIKILPPDVNRSGLKFTPEEAGEAKGIRFGLAGIKNVGEGAMQAAAEERERGGEYRSLEDFCGRLDARKVNKKVVESLVKCGAFDFTGEERASLFAQIDAALSASASTQRDRASGQVSLFGLTGDAGPRITTRSRLPVAPWSSNENLTFEKELLGFYVTGHPLDDYRDVLNSGSYMAVNVVAAEEDRTIVQVAGALVAVEKKFTKKEGKPFAIVIIEDLTGVIEVMVWNEVYKKVVACLEKGRAVSIKGKLDKRDDTPKIVAAEVVPLRIIAVDERPVLLHLPLDKTSEDDLLRLRQVLTEFPGSRPLVLEFTGRNGESVRVRTGAGHQVRWSQELKERLGGWLKN